MSLPTPGETVSAIVRALTDTERVPGSSEYSLVLDRRSGDAAALIRERDEQVRADERARVSVVHSTLTDEQLVDELVRRGVLREHPGDRRMTASGTTMRRYVTPWQPVQPDTRTAEQRTDDAITTLRRRLTGEGGGS